MSTGECNTREENLRDFPLCFIIPVEYSKRANAIEWIDDHCKIYCDVCLNFPFVAKSSLLFPLRTVP